ncbi:MAG: AAA family ATPase [Pseudomonadales bacterium]|nr:AAA family ATPase [Pseudomonadales bacterium]
MNSGRIVLLNGSSSAGKTTLARAVQVIRREPWFHLALDQFRDGMPPAYRGLNSPDGTPGARGLNVVPVDLDGERVTQVRFGDVGRRMLVGMHRAIAAFAAAGNDTIVDDLFLEPDTLDDYLDALLGFNVLFVGVRADLATVNAREHARRGRFPGTAPSHFSSVHAHGVYDLEVDTSVESARACAARISRRLDDPSPFSAFAELRAQRRRGRDERSAGQ